VNLLAEREAFALLLWKVRRMGESQDCDFRGAGGLEDAGALVQRRATGDYVVNEEEPFAGDLRRPHDLESVSDVRSSLLGGEAHLRAGVADSPEASLHDGNAKMSGEGPCQISGLIKAPRAIPPPMQGNGHNYVIFGHIGMLPEIIQDQPAQEGSEVASFSVLEQVNKLPQGVCINEGRIASVMIDFLRAALVAGEALNRFTEHLPSALAAHGELDGDKLPGMFDAKR